MGAISVSQIRNNLAEFLNRAIYGHERLLIERHGKKVAAIVPLEDLELLSQLEDKIDLEAARAALKEPGSVSWEKIKAEFKL